MTEPSTAFEPQSAPEHPNLTAALVAFQAEITNVGKSQTATIQPKDHSKAAFSFPYADLASVIDHVRPVLTRHGLVAIQNVESHGGCISVWTLLLHESGEKLTLGPVQLPAGTDNKQTGGSITSARRFALMASLGIASVGEDAGDDSGSSGPRATSRQIAKINAEVERGKIEPDELAKVLVSYSVTSPDALSRQQASDLIDRLVAEADRRMAAAAAGADPKTGEVTQ